MPPPGMRVPKGSENIPPQTETYTGVHGNTIQDRPEEKQSGGASTEGCMNKMADPYHGVLFGHEKRGKLWPPPHRERSWKT